MHIKTHKKVGKILSNIALILFLGIAVLCFFSANWYVDVYGKLGFDSVLSTLSGGMRGVQWGLVGRYLLGGALPAVLCTAAISLFLFLPRKKLFLKRWISISVSLILSVCLITHAAFHAQLVDYIVANSTDSYLIEEQYRDPNKVTVTFPEQKRNLIYIFLESMEITFADTENGGAMAENRIPELTQLAQENLNFSHTDGVGGFRESGGASWTIGAMVAQTAGIPLKLPNSVADMNGYGQQGVFLPGVTSLQGILHDNGYTQALMVGSDSKFGGRNTYFSTHGIDKIYDLYTAYDDGIVPENYNTWWGMEDLHLYKYAKKVLTELAAEETPFAFTMLTVDTHHVGGYKCSLCGTEYKEKYENVYACASRQLSAFITWLQQQSFYENTTVIIVGDHKSMDNEYFKRTVGDDYVRRMYNCFLNPAIQPINAKNREFTTVDLFPTTLAAIGCTIEGDRLGLGVNLFSDVPTLTESMGYDAFCNELACHSPYYSKNFLME